MNSAYWALGISVTVVSAAITFAYKFGKWRAEVDSDRLRFSKFMEEIRNDIKDLLSRLPSSPTTSASPIRLTDLEERISTNINAKSWAEKVANEMVEQTKGFDLLKIQEESFEKAQSFEPDKSLLQNMRDSAFREGINLNGVRAVLGVELRDCLLALHGKTRDALEK